VELRRHSEYVQRSDDVKYSVADTAETAFGGIWRCVLGVSVKVDCQLVVVAVVADGHEGGVHCHKLSNIG